MTDSGPRASATGRPTDSCPNWRSSADACSYFDAVSGRHPMSWENSDATFEILVFTPLTERMRQKRPELVASAWALSPVGIAVDHRTSQSIPALAVDTDGG
jgi:hypothetical protein